MPDAPGIRVSVVYAGPDRAFNVELTLPKGSRVVDAIETSGIRAMLPGIAIRDDRIGIFARKASPDALLSDGDRVEIYRPLKVDPKEARRKRAGKTKRKRDNCC
ncbi:MAG: RnfH family protein [Rhodanobacteraceae bacterium]|nr:MAG: RnfH family protein [Rhodanobacteraceae bacterium]